VPSYSDAIGVGSAPGTVESVYDLAGVTTVRLSGLCVNLAAAPGSGKSRTLTLRKNAASVTSTVTISDLATTGTDSTHSDTIADGDHFNVSFQPTGTPAAADHRWAFVQEVVTAASGETAQPFVILPV
jgi:hypothetical protein